VSALSLACGAAFVTAQGNLEGRDVAKLNTSENPRSEESKNKDDRRVNSKSKKTSSEDNSTRKRKPKQTKSITRDSASEIRTARRLPKYFGQLELSDEQRDKVYGIQAKYLKQIEQLEKRITELREKMGQDSEDVLTPTQKRSFAKLKQTASRPADLQESQ
jgi:uncharacterized protein YyaL (SSP411 family)